MRDLDDKVIYALNNSLPTATIRTRTAANPEANCKGLYDSLRVSYFQREKMIQDCIEYTAEEIGRLKHQRDESSDIQVEKKFKSEQRKVSLQFNSLINFENIATSVKRIESNPKFG